MGSNFNQFLTLSVTFQFSTLRGTEGYRYKGHRYNNPLYKK